MLVGSRPMKSGATSVSSVAFVPLFTTCPKASPQPTTPVSVMTLTSRVSMWVQRCPAKSWGGPPMSNGIETMELSIAVIFMTSLA